jgi:hypothetical protein
MILNLLLGDSMLVYPPQNFRERIAWQYYTRIARPLERWSLRGLRWRLKQRLAGESRYYGNGGTIHGSTQLDVETYRGTVVAVWFRCQLLPFRQREADQARAIEMERASWGDPPMNGEGVNARLKLTGVEVLDG